MVKNDDNLMCMLPHILGLFTSWIGPLVMFIVLKKDASAKALSNAKHALNFQLSMMIYYFISGILIIVIIGFLLLWALGVFALIVGIIAIIRSYNGEVYKYPLEIEFLK
jgi:uncharacterized protein